MSRICVGRFVAPLVFVVFAGPVGAQSLLQRCLIPGVSPGEAHAKVGAGAVVLSNKSLMLRWTYGAHGMGRGSLYNALSRETILLNMPFMAREKGGAFDRSSEMNLTEGPSIEDVAPNSEAAQLAARLPGKQVKAIFQDSKGELEVDWKAILLDGSNYVRQECTFKALKADVPLDRILLVDARMPGGEVRGSVLGSPIASQTFFAGFEHPVAGSKADQGHIWSWIDRKLPLQPATPAVYSSVYGVSSSGQLRRGFLNYVERERAHPYRPFLHYNSWYDIAYGGTFNEAQSIDAINAFGEELVRKRGVKLDSYLFDDGWDDTNSVWRFHSGFPNGFTPLREAAAKYGAGPGVWLSPWGGYGDSRKKRLATGKSEGYEIDSQGYALSGPKYFEHFRSVCLDFVRKYGINQFKFDGTGSPDKQYPGSAFTSDFEAAIQLIKDLRQAKPELFVNLTTGTWPSPFWLRYADSTWRGGDDHSFAGVGTFRQKWITYRDGDTYSGVVQKGKLYPLTSLMLHGLIYAKNAEHLMTDPGDDFQDEIHDYFGSGTQLQEMYITHSLLTEKNWDDIAESAKWSRANMDVLVDTHWLGGDPMKLQVYGWASWSPRKGIIVLRNPSDKSQLFSIDARKAFELPAGASGRFMCRSPWKHKGAAQPVVGLIPGLPTTVSLRPFQVLVLDAIPEKSPR